MHVYICICMWVHAVKHSILCINTVHKYIYSIPASYNTLPCLANNLFEAVHKDCRSSLKTVTSLALVLPPIRSLLSVAILHRWQHTLAHYTKTRGGVSDAHCGTVARVPINAPDWRQLPWLSPLTYIVDCLVPHVVSQLPLSIASRENN